MKFFATKAYSMSTDWLKVFLEKPIEQEWRMGAAVVGRYQYQDKLDVRGEARPRLAFSSYFLALSVCWGVR